MRLHVLQVASMGQLEGADAWKRPKNGGKAADEGGGEEGVEKSTRSRLVRARKLTPVFPQ